MRKPNPPVLGDASRSDARASAAKPGSPALIRDATPADLAAVQRIYAHHVLHGLASFEEVPPDLAEIRRRYEDIRHGSLPFLVAEEPDSRHAVLGYAYASRYRARSGYRYSLEDSIYIEDGMRGRGLGRLLLQALLARCEALPYRQMIAVIGDSGNTASIALHAALGFQPAGVFHSVGFKFGRWVDTVQMQRTLGAGDSTLPER